MDLKRLVTHFTYRIEEKPGGGFIAHASDPTVPALEAPTRLELQEKIRQNISAALATEFPQFQQALAGQQTKVEFHIERGADGSFALHSGTNQQPANVAEHEIESKFAEKLLNFAGKHLMPEMNEALAAKLAAGDVKVFVTTTRFGKTGSGQGPASLSSSIANLALDGTSGGPPGNDAMGSVSNNALGNVTYSGDNSPIHRTTQRSSGLLRFLLALLIIGAMMYFYLRFR